MVPVISKPTTSRDSHPAADSSARSQRQAGTFATTLGEGFRARSVRERPVNRGIGGRQLATNAQVSGISCPWPAPIGLLWEQEAGGSNPPSPTRGNLSSLACPPTRIHKPGTCLYISGRATAILDLTAVGRKRGVT